MPAVGRPVEFDPIHVLDVAVQILTERGVDGLTMRGLAARAGTTLASVYRHLGDKDAVLGAALDRYSLGLPRPALPQDPAERLTVLTVAVYDVLGELPWVVDVLRRGGQVGASALWFADRSLGALRDLGATAERAVELYRPLWAYTVGALLTRVEPERPLQDGTPAATKIRQVAEREGLSHVPAFIGAPAGVSRATFITGAEVYIAGVVARVRPRRD